MKYQYITKERIQWVLVLAIHHCFSVAVTRTVPGERALTALMGKNQGKLIRFFDLSLILAYVIS